MTGRGDFESHLNEIEFEVRPFFLLFLKIVLMICIPYERYSVTIVLVVAVDAKVISFFPFLISFKDM